MTPIAETPPVSYTAQKKTDPLATSSETQPSSDPFSASTPAPAQSNGGEKLPSWLSGNPPTGNTISSQPVDPLASSPVPSENIISTSEDPFSAPSGPKNAGLFQDAPQEDAPDWLKEVVSTEKITQSSVTPMDDPFASNMPASVPLGNIQTTPTS